MKKSNIFLTLFSVILLIATSCNNTNNTEAVNNSDKTETEATIKKDTKLTCLFTQVPVWKTPSSSKWLSNVFLGEEMKYLGETVVDSSSKRKSTYYKVELSDGQEAWVNAYHVELDSKPAVCIKDVTTYKRPTDIAITDNKLEAISIIAIKESKDDKWIKIVVPNLEKWSKSTVWIKNSDISEKSEDIGAASIYHKIMNKKGEESKAEKLEKILELIDSYNNSSVYNLIQDKLIEIKSSEIDQEEGNVVEEPEAEAETEEN